MVLKIMLSKRRKKKKEKKNKKESKIIGGLCKAVKVFAKKILPER
jgi:hypothetical protein